MAEGEPKLGHATFRLDKGLHRELLDIAETLGMDFGGLLKTILAEALPTFRARAKQVRTRSLASSWDVEPDSVGLVLAAIRASFTAPERDRAKVQKGAVKEIRELEPVELQRVLLAAQRCIDEIQRDYGADLELWIEGK